jgi:hypothetical protein
VLESLPFVLKVACFLSPCHLAAKNIECDLKKSHLIVETFYL